MGEMNTQEALLTRRTVHFYEPEPVDEALIEQALEAAIRAPNHKLTNPWRFTRVGPVSREQITALGVSLKCDEAASDSKREKVRRKLADPPVLLIVSQRLSEDAHTRQEDYASVACAIQNLSLSLWANGLGSKWSSGAITRHEQTYAIAGIDPLQEEIVGFVWAGTPKPGPTTPRAPLESVVRRLP